MQTQNNSYIDAGTIKNGKDFILDNLMSGYRVASDIAKCAYMKQAYDSKMWGFVPDYARLDIIYQEGGIYLDTDVELIRKPGKPRG